MNQFQNFDEEINALGGWLVVGECPDRKRGFFRGTCELLKNEVTILLNIGLLTPLPKWKNIEVEILNNRKVTAIVGYSQQKKRMQIAIGASYLSTIHTLMSWILPNFNQSEFSRDVFVSRKRIKNILEHSSPFDRKEENALWGDYFLLLDVKQQQEVSEGVKIAALFILYHELAHILQGHISKMNSGQEIEQICSRLNVAHPNFKIRRFFENDADAHAAMFMTQRLLAGPLSLDLHGNTIDYSPQKKMNNLIVAIATLFVYEDAIINYDAEDFELYNLEDFDTQFYPHPLVRCNFVRIFIQTTLKKSNSLINKIKQNGEELSLAVNAIIPQFSKLGMILGFSAGRWQWKGDSGEKLAQKTKEETERYMTLKNELSGVTGTDLEQAYHLRKEQNV